MWEGAPVWAAKGGITYIGDETKSSFILVDSFSCVVATISLDKGSCGEWEDKSGLSTAETSIVIGHKAEEVSSSLDDVV